MYNILKHASSIKTDDIYIKCIHNKCDFEKLLQRRQDRLEEFSVLSHCGFLTKACILRFGGYQKRVQTNFTVCELILQLVSSTIWKYHLPV